jgi:uncharacterized protein
VVIPSLEGNVIEDYATKLFNSWGIGDAKMNNGVLLLIAMNDRKIRIEIGKGFQQSITELNAKLIIDYDLAPEMKNKNYFVGINKVIDKLNQSVPDLHKDFKS